MIDIIDRPLLLHLSVCSLIAQVETPGRVVKFGYLENVCLLWMALCGSVLDDDPQWAATRS